MKNIIYEQVESLPSNLVNGYQDDTNHENSASNLYWSKIKLLALHQDNPIGFICGDYSANGRIIETKGLYVDSDFRENGIGSKLVSRFILKAKKEKLNGLDLDFIVSKTSSILDALKEKYKNNSWLKIWEFWRDSDDELPCGRVRFNY